MAITIVFQCKVCSKILKTVRSLKDHHKRLHKNFDVKCADYTLIDLNANENSDTAAAVDVDSEVTDKPADVIDMIQRPTKTAVAKFRPPLRSILPTVPQPVPVNIPQQQTPALVQVIPLIPQENIPISGPPGATNTKGSQPRAGKRKKEPKKKESKRTKFDFFAGLTLQQANMEPLSFGWNKTVSTTHTVANLLSPGRMTTTVQAAIGNDGHMADSSMPSFYNEQVTIPSASNQTAKTQTTVDIPTVDIPAAHIPAVQITAATIPTATISTATISKATISTATISAATISTATNLSVPGRSIIANAIPANSIEVNLIPANTNRAITIPATAMPTTSSKLETRGRGKKKPIRPRWSCGDLSCSPCSILVNCNTCHYCLNRVALKQKCVKRRCSKINVRLLKKTGSSAVVGETVVDVIKAVSQLETALEENKDDADEEHRDVDVSVDKVGVQYELGSKDQTKEAFGREEKNVGFDNSAIVVDIIAGLIDAVSNRSEEDFIFSKTFNPRPKIYACDKCNHMFSQFKSATKHIKICKGAVTPNFVSCEFCKKSVSKKNLKRHNKAMHTTTKPVEILRCNGCDISFSAKNKLKEHMEVKHSQARINPDSVIECPYEGCEFKHYLLRFVKAHITMTHSDRVKDSCTICSFMCHSRWGMSRHMRTVHEGQMDEMLDGKHSDAVSIPDIAISDLMDISSRDIREVSAGELVETAGSAADLETQLEMYLEAGDFETVCVHTGDLDVGIVEGSVLSFSSTSGSSREVIVPFEDF